ncbi:MAG: hypothetical protein IPP05_22170 [Cytophagaceae bacterium]|nr:hypothetical protein [Cytophagaceae bacterium]
MAISINIIHDDIRATLKDNTSGFVSPEDIDHALNNACIDVLKEVIDEYESRTSMFGPDQSMLYLYNFTGIASDRTLPNDVFKVAAVYDNDYEGDLLDYSEFNDRLNSVIIPPSSTRPIATVYNDGAAKIRILPSSSTHKIKYWKNPATCKYGYTESSGNTTFVSGTSTNIDFPISHYTRILTKALVYLAPNSKNKDSVELEQILR